MDIEQELWDALEHESPRAYEAFRCYLALPPGQRTMVAAYRDYVGNSEASKVSDTWRVWCADHAWSERARAYDAHMERIRRQGMEQAIEEEAKLQMRRAEKVRNRFHELLTAEYEAALSWLEEVGHDGMRASDVIAITRLHLEHVEKFGSDEGEAEDEWTEEDDEFVDGFLRDLEAKADVDEPEGGEDDSDSVDGDTG